MLKMKQRNNRASRCQRDFESRLGTRAANELFCHTKHLGCFSSKNTLLYLKNTVGKTVFRSDIGCRFRIDCLISTTGLEVPFKSSALILKRFLKKPVLNNVTSAKFAYLEAWQIVKHLVLRSEKLQIYSRFSTWVVGTRTSFIQEVSAWLLQRGLASLKLFDIQMCK